MWKVAGADHAARPSPHAHELAFGPYVEESLVAEWGIALWRAPALRRYLERKRGLEFETVVTWSVGWDGHRLTIPIRNWHGRVVNVRRYLPHAPDGVPKIISYREGYGGARLWPPSSIWRPRDEPILLTEGELDCLVALQAGLRAITSTGGAGRFDQAWAQWFRGQRVWIAYDQDDAGRAGAQKVAAVLSPETSEVRILDLPVLEEGGDLSDLFLSLREEAGRGT